MTKMKSLISKSNGHAYLIVLSFGMLFFHDTVMQADAHGFMLTPRTRNEFAAQDGVDGGGTIGLPPKEYCSHCLNTNQGVCGESPNFNYDEYKDSVGNPMPWISQETYMEGQVITVKSYLDTPHNGHMELKACPNGNGSNQACFDTPGHELIFQEDVLYNMPADPSYPERGYYAGGQGGGLKSHEMRFKLPDGITGNEVMLQYKYITANSCSPPGYQEYFNGANSQNKVIDSSFWTPGLGLCTPPYPNDGTRGTTWPEQFFNCAEVTITESAPSPPTPPTTPSPTITKQPTLTPVQPPISTGSGCCSWSPYLECTQPDNTWCQESIGNCEGACNGKWLVSNPPTAYPVYTPTTTPSPTKSPVAEPPTSTSGCCSINFKTCHHEEGTFCSISEENCVGPCGKYWLPNGPVDDCTAQWDACATDDECCAHAICATDGVCRADSWTLPPSPPTTSSPVISPATPSPTATNSPTTFPTNVPTKLQTNSPTKAPACKSWCKDNTLPWSTKCTWAKCSLCEPCGTQSPTSLPTSGITYSPTKSPTAAPVPDPTAAPVPDPTASPTTSPVTGSEFCCSWNLYNCGVSSFCNLSEDNCQGSCGGAWLDKNSEAMSCLAKWEDCTNKEDACCEGTSCQGSNTYKQCA